MTYVTMNLEE